MKLVAQIAEFKDVVDNNYPPGLAKIMVIYNRADLILSKQGNHIPLEFAVAARHRFVFGTTHGRFYISSEFFTPDKQTGVTDLVYYIDHGHMDKYLMQFLTDICLNGEMFVEKPIPKHMKGKTMEFLLQHQYAVFMSRQHRLRIKVFEYKRF